MNSLEKKHWNEIDCITCVYGETPRLDKDDAIIAARDCAKISIEFAKGFGEWVSSNGYVYNTHKVAWHSSIKLAIRWYTTDELIDKYIQTLK